MLSVIYEEILNMQWKIGFYKSHVLASSTGTQTRIGYIFKGLSLIDLGNLGHELNVLMLASISGKVRQNLNSAIIVLLNCLIVKKESKYLTSQTFI